MTEIECENEMLLIKYIEWMWFDKYVSLYVSPIRSLSFVSSLTLEKLFLRPYNSSLEFVKTIKAVI